MFIKDVTLTFSHLAPKNEDESMALVHVEKQKGRFLIQKLLFSKYIEGGALILNPPKILNQISFFLVKNDLNGSFPC